MARFDFRLLISLAGLFWPLSQQSKAGTRERDSQFEAWFGRACAVGGDRTPLDGVRITYRVTRLRVPPPAELAALRKEVQGHPEHPRRSELQGYEQTLRQPDVHTYSLWRYNGMWRYNHDFPTGFQDLTWGNGIAWALSANTLTILDPRTAANHPLGIPQCSSAFNDDCFLLFNGDIGAALLNGATLSPVLDEGLWSCSWSGTQDDDKFDVKASGTWNSVVGWGTVDSVDISRTHNGITAGRIVRTSDWRACEQLRLGFAGHVTVADHTGAPEANLDCLSIDTFTAADFAQLARRPEPNAPDPVRGTLTFRSVVDRSGAQITVAARDPNGTLVPQGRVPTARAELHDRIRILGWIIAISSLVLIGVLRVRKSAA